MNLFVMLIVVVIMLIAAVSYAKGQRTKRKAAEAYAKDLQRDLASMAEHNQELQKINRENSEKLAELVATPDTDLDDRANTLFSKEDELLSSLKELREQAGLSVRKAAQLTGISSTHFSAIENGKRKPSEKTRESLEKVFKDVKKK